MESKSTRPWYREPMVWMVIALPTSAVIAGLTTLTIAIYHGDKPIRDPLRGVAKYQIGDQAPEQLALRLGLSGVVTLAEQGTRLQLSGRTEGGQPERLTLVLWHATRPELDQELILERAEDGHYLAPALDRRGRAYHAVLSSPEVAWRLRGELDADGAILVLRALAEPSA